MRTVVAVIGLFMVGVLALTQMGCSSEAQSKEPESQEEEAAVPVEAAHVERGEASAFFTGTASLEAEEEATVVAKAGGIVEELFAEEGDYVEAGQPLVQLDDERLALELERAEVNLAKLKRVYERNEGLFEKNLISTEEYERVKSEYEAQQAARDMAQLELEFTTVRAPISGIVAERLVKVGNMVETHSATFHITDFQPLHAIMHVPERELNKIEVGQHAELRLDALPGQSFAGRVKLISPVVNSETGTFKVTVEVDNASRRLKPGMFGRVNIIYDTRKHTLLVPKEAVMEEDDRAEVFVVRDSMAVRQVVETGYTHSNRVEVRSGLQEGDTVIVTGQGNLRDSSRVEVIE